MNFFQQAQEVPRCYKELYDKHGKVLGYDIKRQNHYICIDNSLWSTCFTLNITPICSLFCVQNILLPQTLPYGGWSRYDQRDPSWWIFEVPWSKGNIKIFFFGNRTWAKSFKCSLLSRVRVPKWSKVTFATIQFSDIKTKIPEFFSHFKNVLLN